MRRIAHLSDVHILSPRGGPSLARGARRYHVTTKLVSLGQGRGSDHVERGRRLARALAMAKAQGADHVVISGDLTEVGAEEEFEHFAEVLHDAGLAEDSVTLVPGNHDRYTRNDGWARAIAGPFARFARASAAVKPEAAHVVERDGVVFLPIDSTRFQTIAWSGGIFTRATAAALSRRISDPAFRDKAIVLVLHHPPFYPRAPRIFEWVDGLRGRAEVLELLARHPRLQLLHGHLHRVFDRILARSRAAGFCLRPGSAHDVEANDATLDEGSTIEPVRDGAPPRIRVFGAPATCDGPDDAPRIRLYDVADGALRAAPAVVAA